MDRQQQHWALHGHPAVRLEPAAFTMASVAARPAPPAGCTPIERALTLKTARRRQTHLRSEHKRRQHQQDAFDAARRLYIAQVGRPPPPSTRQVDLLRWVAARMAELAQRRAELEQQLYLSL